MVELRSAPSMDELTRRAENAEQALIDEYRVWRRTWEANPTMDAMKEAIIVIRLLVARLEAEANRG